MQLTASKLVVFASGVCRRASMLRGMHRGLAAADLLTRQALNRAVSIIVAPVLSASSCHAREPSIAESDYLIPPHGIIQSDYYALLRRKLFISPSDFLRIVDLPSGANEAVVAIYTVRSSGEDDVRITYTTPHKLLWEAGADSQNRFVKDPRVSITRIDAPFPRSLALTVSAAIRRLVRERRPPLKTERVIVDGRLVEFSVLEGDQTIRALLTPYMEGPKGTSLNNLVDLLRRYCVARSERPRTAEAIAREAAKMMRYPTRKRPNQAMQLTASKSAIYTSRVCPRASMLRGMHRGLATADVVSR